MPVALYGLGYLPAALSEHDDRRQKVTRKSGRHLAKGG
jgi:hypothetical protein